MLLSMKHEQGDDGRGIIAVLQLTDIARAGSLMKRIAANN
jgi:hypothetical protein